MALVFCDGFDSYAATADLLKKWAVAMTPWAWGTGADQNAAAGGIVSCATTLAQLRPPPSLFTGSPTRIGLGFWLKVSAAPASGVDIVQWYNSAADYLGALRLTTSGFMQLVTNIGGSVFIGATNVCDNAWHWIEVAPQIGSGALQRGIADSTSQWNGNGTMYGAAAYFDRITFLSIASRTVSISDVMIYDNVGSDFTVGTNFPLTARKITTKRPDGDDVIQLTRSTGSTSYTLIDEVNADTSDYVSGSTAVQDTYNYAAIGISPTTVNAVVVNSCLMTPLPGVINCRQLAKSNVTTAEGVSLPAPSVTPRVVQQPFYVDPNTAAAWTQAGIDAAKFGIKIEVSAGPALLLDAVIGVTAAYSFSRKLLTAASSTYYTSSGGVIDTLIDQIGSRTFSGTTVTRPNISTAGPNGRACVDFGPVANGKLSSGSAVANFFSASAGYIAISCIVDTIATNEAVPYNNVPLIGDGGGYVGIYFRDTGTPKSAIGFNWDGSADAASVAAITLGTAYVIEYWHDAGSIFCCVNNGTPVSTLSGNQQSGGGIFELAHAYSGSPYFFDGKVFEFFTASAVPVNRTTVVADMMTWVGAV